MRKDYTMDITTKSADELPKIVVFGGSGFIGTHLIRVLATKGNVSIVSVDINLPREKLDSIEYRLADVRNLEGLQVFGKIDRIYDLAALCVIPKYESHKYYDVNVSGAISITGFARRHSVKDIVFVSSMATYGAGERSLHEISEQTPDNAYGWSKLIAERIYKQWQTEIDERKLIICRPAVIFGSGENGNFTRLAKFLKYGIFVFPGRRDTIKACYYVKDLVFDLITIPDINRRGLTVFNACYDYKYTIEHIVYNMQLVMNNKVRLFTMPASFLKVIASLLNMFNFFGLGIHPDRINKLVVSTNLEPVFLREQGLAKADGLLIALQDWKNDCNEEWT